MSNLTFPRSSVLFSQIVRCYIPKEIIQTQGSERIVSLVEQELRSLAGPIQRLIGLK